ncbi:MAG: hypothetical protein GEU80_11245 [Dehalococcoidia bacterium]|nr:hypothetical protein [Dehalococcoidia bacterium]
MKAGGANGKDDPIQPDLPIAEPPQRVSGMRVPDGWTLPGKPADLDPAAEDAWRQTGFSLGADLRLVAQDLDLQTRFAKSGYAPSARNMTMTAFASLWSRALLTESDASGLVRRGSYQGALPLVRQAVELVGAQAGLGEELDEWRRWTHEAFGRHEATRSTEVGIGHYFSGEGIANDPHLRLIYRAASDFGRPNFGPTALFVANEASHERYPLVFGDQAFHLGWAQLLLGWLLRVGVAQLHIAMHLQRFFPAPEGLRAEVAEHIRAVEAHLEDPARCRLEEVEDEDGRRRHLLVEFRRQVADAPKRLLF